MKRLILALCLLASPALAQQPDTTAGYRELLMEANDRAVMFNTQAKACTGKEELLRKEIAELKAKLSPPEEKK